MASSNRHWPSMFKSKPCTTTSHHHQWQHHDINSSLLSTGTCHRSPYAAGCEERSPEPKPRWNPKPEQIRILEAIFNSGMVNPPRDEIRKIRAQLQEYGQVGDANVFYWFQNRKSRSKHKQRHLQNASKSQNQQQPPPISTAPTTSSSSSSDRSSPNKSMDKAFSLLNSPTASVNQQPYFGSHHGDQFFQEPYFFQPNVGSTNGTTTTTTTGGFSQGLCFSELGSVINGNHDQTVGNCSGLLLTELMMMNNHGIIPKNSTPTPTKAEEEKMKMHQQMNNYTAPPSTSTVHSILPPPTTVTVPSTINHTQGAGIGGNGGLGSVRSTVFINDVQIEVGVGPINLRDTFDDEYVLVHSTGQPVLTNDWGVTLQPLQHGASYYLVPRTLATSPLSTIDLM